MVRTFVFFIRLTSNAMNPIFKSTSKTVSKDDESSQPLLGGSPQVNRPQLHMPKAPKMPEISTTLRVPEMPQAPKMPEISTTLRVPEMPQAPKMPEVSQAVKVPQMLDGPQVPQVLATVTTPLIDVYNIPKSSAILLFKSMVSSYLTSGTQKQAVIYLVIIDLSKSLVSIILNFIQAEIQGTYLEHLSILIDAIRSILASVGSLISNAFVLELVASWWVFGWGYNYTPPALAQSPPHPSQSSIQV
ncbi:hypothetical protein Golomagni_02767 [Golovinomyces magnicellulatus]|nr:hypothetical protein Golomagni_02767 [Golovinomyces magnicellulatus]